MLDAHMSGEADTTSGDPDATADSGVDVDDRAIDSVTSHLLEKPFCTTGPESDM